MPDTPSLFTLQQAFKQALFSAEPLGDSNLMVHLDPTLPNPVRRLQAYRDNVIISLINVLQAAYPVIHQMIGEDHFRILARDFVRQHPPLQAHLSVYGGAFSDFCASYPALQQQFSYISDIASLEWARNMAFQAEEAVSLTPEKAAEIDQEVLLSSTLIWHPSLSLIPVDHQISFLFDVTPSPDALPTSQKILGEEVHIVWCDGWHVHSQLSSAEESFFLQLLSTPTPLHHILEEYLQTHTLTTLQTVLATQLQHGRLCLSTSPA